MDWNNPLAMFGIESSDEMVDDEYEEFYGAEESSAIVDAKPGASSIDRPSNGERKNAIPLSVLLTPAEKADNQRKAEVLRAKLLAQRQNTPSKPISRVNTPIKSNASITNVSLTHENSIDKVPQPSTEPQNAQSQTKSSNETTATQPIASAPQSSKEVSSLEALLAEGKAMADARAAALIIKANGDPVHNKSVGRQETKMTPQAKAKTSLPTQSEPTRANQTTEHQKHPTDLSHSYYADLPAWLEMTGYHDVEFRDSKLRTYKERKELELEAARIAEKLDRLRRAEEEVVQSLRMGTPTLATNMAPPPLPASLPAEKAVAQVNGSKRSRSPEPSKAEKARRRGETGGFRIRGANYSPDTRPGSSRHANTPSPTHLEHGPGYPDARRRSIDEYNGSRSRDPSLERRQSYYRHDCEPIRYDHHTSRDTPRSGYGGSRPPNLPNRSQQPQYNGSAPSELRKGGQPTRFL